MRTEILLSVGINAHDDDVDPQSYFESYVRQCSDPLQAAFNIGRSVQYANSQGYDLHIRVFLLDGPIGSLLPILQSAVREYKPCGTYITYEGV